MKKIKIEEDARFMFPETFCLTNTGLLINRQEIANIQATHYLFFAEETGGEVIELHKDKLVLEYIVPKIYLQNVGFSNSIVSSFYEVDLSDSTLTFYHAHGSAASYRSTGGFIPLKVTIRRESWFQRHLATWIAFAENKGWKENCKQCSPAITNYAGTEPIMVQQAVN